MRLQSSKCLDLFKDSGLEVVAGLAGDGSGLVIGQALHGMALVG